MHTLEKYYPGDSAFIDLAHVYTGTWESCNFSAELVSAVKDDITMAKVVYGLLGNESLSWLERPIPALDGLSAKECLKTENGIKRLKTCLMRMPC